MSAGRPSAKKTRQVVQSYLSCSVSLLPGRYTAGFESTYSCHTTKQTKNTPLYEHIDESIQSFIFGHDALGEPQRRRRGRWYKLLYHVVYRSYHAVTIWHVTLYQANWCWTAKDYLRQPCALTVKTPACSLIAAASAYLALRC